LFTVFKFYVIKSIIFIWYKSVNKKTKSKRKKIFSRHKHFILVVNTKVSQYFLAVRINIFFNILVKFTTFFFTFLFNLLPNITNTLSCLMHSYTINSNLPNMYVMKAFMLSQWDEYELRSVTLFLELFFVHILHYIPSFWYATERISVHQYKVKL